jgi:hypothetical protein
MTNKNNNLTNANIENVEVVNTRGPEWVVPIGNAPNYIVPEALKYKGPRGAKPTKSFGILPAFMKNKSN